jgi:hypothetical protein
MTLLITTVILLVLCCGTVVGYWLRHVLAERHFNRDTLDSMRLVMSMLITFAALVLGLLTSTVKARFDRQTDELRSYSINLIELDQRLRNYGPDAAATRALIRRYTAAAIFDTWPTEPRPSGIYPVGLKARDSEHVESLTLGDMLNQAALSIDTLVPDDAFHERQALALQAHIANTKQIRWTLIEMAHSTISWPFLLLLIFWLTVVFTMFGLIAPRNRVMYATIFCCGLSVASALLLILSFDTPYGGLLSLPSEPLRDALAHMDGP